MTDTRVYPRFKKVATSAKVEVKDGKVTKTVVVQSEDKPKA